MNDRSEYKAFWAQIGNRSGAPKSEESEVPEEGTLSEQVSAHSPNRVPHRTTREQDRDGCEILIVTAVDDEFEAIRQIFRIEEDSEEIELASILYRRVTYQSKGHRTRIGFLHLNEMGMVPAASKVSKHADRLGCKFVMAVGICGGKEGKISIGDVIVANNTFNYDQVKVQADGNLADYPHAPLSDRISNIVNSLLQQNDLASDVESAWPSQAERPNTRLAIRTGSIATGSALVADKAVFREISQHQRKVIGLDMEAYAIARACHYLDVGCLIVKSVSDFASIDKAELENGKTSSNGKYRKYACYTAAAVAQSVIDRFLISNNFSEFKYVS